MDTVIYVCRTPHDLPLLLLWVGVVGLNLGILLTRSEHWINSLLRQGRTAWKQRARGKSSFVQAEQQALIEEDERLMCSVCWDDRHPSMRSPFPWMRLCVGREQQCVLGHALPAQLLQRTGACNTRVAEEDYV